jgi:riboflavin synthase
VYFAICNQKSEIYNSMFTGLIDALGIVKGVDADDPGRNLAITAIPYAGEVQIGDSVAVNGVCLTVVRREGPHFKFQAGPETLRRTNLGELGVGDRVNLERPLRPSDRMDGHFVQGHVDGIGRIAERNPQGEWETVWISSPPELTRYMASKGSVAVDGVSLTLVDVAADRFSVALIPHTLAKTTLGFKQVGASVNLETDILAKYVAKLLANAPSGRGKTA